MERFKDSLKQFVDDEIDLAALTQEL